MEDLKPSSREEAVLAKIAGIEDPMVDAFEPSSREEWFMNQIAERMGEGGGGSGGGSVFVDFTASGAKFIATKTAGEIFNLIMDGNAVVFRRKEGDLAMLMPCLGASNVSEYRFYVCMGRDVVNYFVADTASDYPTVGDR